MKLRAQRRSIFMDRPTALKISALTLFAALVFSFAFALTEKDEIGLTPSSRPEPAARISIQCFDSATALLRTSDTTLGCAHNEISLGSGAILAPVETPTALNPILSARFLAARAAAMKAGFTIEIISGFRDKKYQQRLFENAVKKYGSEKEASKWVLPSEYSHHLMGLAIDVNYPSGKSGALWLEIEGWKFGLCRVYENEWWHFEGVIASGQLCPALRENASLEIPRE